MSRVSGVESKGNQMKIFDEKSDCWFKADNLGYEGLSEFITSKLLSGSNLNHVNYELCKFKIGGKEVIGCKSKNFLGVGDSVMSAYSVFKQHYGYDLVKKLVNLDLADGIKYTIEMLSKATGCENFGDYLTKILQLDALIINDDRHFRNISFIYNEHEGYRLCPVYDNGGAFLSDEFSYGLDEGVFDLIDEVVSLPFSRVFDEQVDACEVLGHEGLVLQQESLQYEKWKQVALKFYSDVQFNRVETVLRQMARKYRYLFCKV